ncbi:hypothetical protein [Exiguobacterium flavidum]|uniref:hypothetical protein n=1 Tax=Exiguobacterium flavidum TaxID=2184695 RepID=UPI000DF82A43|nr:hypothetical protein [Exiguobacterium flavidum]
MWILPLKEPVSVSLPGYIGKLTVTSTLKTDLGPVLRLLMKAAAQHAATAEIVEVTALSEGVIHEQADWFVRRGMLGEDAGDYHLTEGGRSLYERLVVSERLDGGGWSVFFNSRTEKLSFRNGLEEAYDGPVRLTRALYQGDNPLDSRSLIESTDPPREIIDQLAAEQLLLKLSFDHGISPVEKPYVLRAAPSYYEDVFEENELLETSATLGEGPTFDLLYPMRRIRLVEPAVLREVSEGEWEQLEAWRVERPDWLSDEAKGLLAKRDAFLAVKDTGIYADEATGSYSSIEPERGESDYRLQGEDRSEELLVQLKERLREAAYDPGLLTFAYETFWAVKRLPLSWLEEVRDEGGI